MIDSVPAVVRTAARPSLTRSNSEGASLYEDRAGILPRSFSFVGRIPIYRKVAVQND
jgi:hypothetical protein